MSAVTEMGCDVNEELYLAEYAEQYRQAVVLPQAEKRARIERDLAAADGCRSETAGGLASPLRAGRASAGRCLIALGLWLAGPDGDTSSAGGGRRLSAP